MEPLVIRGRQTKHTQQRTITASRVLEASVDQGCEVVPRQLVRLERLMHDRPEAFAGNQALPQSIGGA